MWYWRSVEKRKWREKVTNEQVLGHIGEKRTLLNNILHRKAISIDLILRINCLLLGAIEGQITEGKSRKKNNTFHDDLKNRIRY